MKKLFSIISIISVFSLSSANADSAVVNTKMVNVRACAGMQCEVIGQLEMGENVIKLSNNGNWVKIEYSDDDKTGYVINRSLTITTSEDMKTLAEASYEFADFLGSLLGIIVIISGLAIGLLILFAPSIIARGNKNGRAVFWVNLLLFWIPLVWLVLLFAALIGEKKEIAPAPVAVKAAAPVAKKAAKKPAKKSSKSKK